MMRVSEWVDMECYHDVRESTSSFIIETELWLISSEIYVRVMWNYWAHAPLKCWIMKVAISLQDIRLERAKVPCIPAPYEICPCIQSNAFQSNLVLQCHFPAKWAFLVILIFPSSTLLMNTPCTVLLPTASRRLKWWDGYLWHPCLNRFQCHG